MKFAVLQALQRAVGTRAGLSAFGDRWVLVSRTGRRELFDDVEALAGAMVTRGLVDDRTLPAGAPLEQLLGAAGGPDAPRPTADGLVAAILVRARHEAPDQRQPLGQGPHPPPGRSGVRCLHQVPDVAGDGEERRVVLP
ncbi:hypothetical protein [Modestobacter marinus]|uniref:hypothetical protein n=1 Tax=Modestobacter marinus TaxID=477641 RepID=UPI001C96A62F|nr:hypothetical protein [Modestobacter marinus]